jgi:undecaprenyl-diphosphatase
VALAGEVVDGDTQWFDDRMMHMLRNPHDPADAIGPRWVENAARDITALGSVVVVCMVTAMVCGYLLLARRYTFTILVLAATGGGLLLAGGLKLLFNRPRPPTEMHLVHVTTSSFPSGHSMLSAIVYLTLAAMLSRVLVQRRFRYYFVALATILSGLIGLSRVYLGVHYPSDVLGGWLAGLAWATFCWLIARWLQKERRVESSV